MEKAVSGVSNSFEKGFASPIGENAKVERRNEMTNALVPSP